MPTYTVTGATGQLGRLVIDELVTRAVDSSDIVAVVRDPGKGADLAARGVSLRQGDYSRPETLTGALEGVDRLLLVSASEPGRRVAQHAAVLDAARAAGASRIAYTSILNADDTTNPLAAEHQATERALQATGVPFTLLRNGWYTENYTGQLAQYLERGEILGAAGTGRVSAASRRDYAGAAAAALLQGEGGDRTHELGGPTFDFAELARVVSEVTGTTVAYRDLSAADYAAALRRAGLDDATAGFVAAIDTSIARGDLATDSGDLERLLGRPATSLADAVRTAHR